MLFVNLTPGQVNAYSYACEKLQHTLNKMSAARITLQQAAATSFDAAFAKCVYLFMLESQQFENEINSQIYSFNCLPATLNEVHIQPKRKRSFSAKNMETLCRYVEENYIKSYKRLLKDKNLNSSLKNLISNHLQVLLSSLTQLRLFKDVKPSFN